MRDIRLESRNLIVIRQDKWVDFNCYLLIGCVLLFSSAASTIAQSDPLLVAFTLYSIALNVLGVRSHSFVNSLLKIILLSITIVVVYTIKNGNIDIYSWYGFFCKILIGYSCVFYCERRFEKYFLKVIYVLGVISLLLYTLQLIDFNLVFRYNNFFSIGENKGLDPNSNSILFNAIAKHNIRNCGFMWEPGAFAAVLIIALAISFKCTSKIDIQKVVMILCIITTFSSMGYISLLIIVVYFLYSKLKYYSVVLIVPLALLFYNFNILSEKIGNQIEDIDNELLSTQFSGDYVIHLNRFASFYADYNTFIENPFVGLGVDIYTVGQKEYYKEYDKNIVRTSGLMSLLVKIGIIGFLFFIITIYNKVKRRYGDSKFAALFVVLLLVILFSNPIELSPVILIFLSL